MLKLQPADRPGRVVVFDAFADGLEPEPLLSIWEWADRHRVLAGVGSAEPGPYRTSRTPYWAEMLEALSPGSPVRDVVVMKGAQVGFSEALCNFVGHVIDSAPGPMLVVMPRDEDVGFVSKTRIDPMIEESPRLRAKVAPSRSRDAGNTVKVKEFPGGVLRMVSARSPAGLRSMPARYLAMDEVDDYPSDVGGEGDPIKLAERRTATFPRAKRLKGSTPTIEGSSRIQSLYEESDQRVYKVPCPECDQYQQLVWRNVRWENDDPSTVRYVCEACGFLIPEHEKTRMLARGRWVAQAPGHATRGYHISALYSPLGWFSWANAVEQLVEATRKNNPELLKVWVNTVLGETWKVKGEAPEWKALHARREPYREGTVPSGGLVLTAGVDVQRDRLEAEVVAWGRRLESWSIAYRVILGDPAKEEVWRELDELLREEFAHELGPGVRIERLGVDAGFSTQDVYRWARQHGRGTSARVIVTRGREELAGMVVGQPKAVDMNRSGRKLSRGSGGVGVWPLNTSALKEELYAWLRGQEPEDSALELPFGWCHFPDAYPEEYFRQLTAEHLVSRRIRRPGSYVGTTVTRWEKHRDRNEALDCRLMARAAAYTIGLDRWDSDRWDRASEQLSRPRQGRGTPPAEKPAPPSRFWGDRGDGSFWK